MNNSSQVLHVVSLKRYWSILHQCSISTKMYHVYVIKCYHTGTKREERKLCVLRSRMIPGMIQCVVFYHSVLMVLFEINKNVVHFATLSFFVCLYNTLIL